MIGMFSDRYGLPLSTKSAVAAERYVEGIDRSLAAEVGAEECLEDAIRADEGFALAHVALARALQLSGRPAEARERAGRARALATSATHREQGHVEAIAVAVESNPARALELVQEHIKEFPRDAFVVSQATGVYGLIGFSGRQDRSAEQLDFLEPLAPAYGDDWWFLGAHAFAYEEIYDFEAARRLVERSLEFNPRNAHGAHVRGHVFLETGDAAGGARFLAGWMPAYDRRAQLHGHLTWHQALFDLAAGRYGQALALFDDGIGPGAASSAAIGITADSAALLWRCNLYGRDPGRERWQAVRAYVLRAFPRAGTTFADMHVALTVAATGDAEALSRLIDELRGRLATGRLPAGEAVVALTEGIAAFGRKDYVESIRLIEPVADQVVRIGGSIAQRDVFEETLLEAYLRAERWEPAEALVRRRLDRRPSARDLFRLARAHAGAGRSEEAAATRDKARALWPEADADAPELTQPPAPFP